MTIIEKEISAKLIEQQCDQCGAGVYRQTGTVTKTTNPMQWEHACSNCDHKTFFTMVFPVIEYKKKRFMLADPLRHVGKDYQANK